MQVGVWSVHSGTPQRAHRSEVNLEAELERWIAADVTLLSEGLTVVGQQIRLDAGPLDLLCLDVRGSWVVVELKRGRLHREVIAQALDYAACMREIDAGTLRSKIENGLSRFGGDTETLAAVDRQLEQEEDSSGREVAVIVAGAGFDAGLERVVNLLADHDLPVRAVSFDVLALPSGEQLLLREVLEEETPSSSAPRPARTVEDIARLAELAGTRKAFDEITSAAQLAGLFARPYTRSVMIAPPTHKNRFLMVLTPDAGRGLRINHGPEAFAEFFPHISADEVESRLGPGGDRWFSGDAALQQAAAVRSFFEEVLSVDEEKPEDEFEDQRDQATI